MNKYPVNCDVEVEVELFTGDYIRKDVDIDFIYNMLYYKTDNIY